MALRRLAWPDLDTDPAAFSRVVASDNKSDHDLHAALDHSGSRGKNPGMYQLFEHTADLGLRVRAATLDELFAEAGCGLFSMIVVNLDQVEHVKERRFELAGDAIDYLLFDWLNELLYAFESQHLLFSKFEVHVSEQGLTATAFGEEMDEPRHQMDHEVKAITYHGLTVEKGEHGWSGEVIVDI